MKNNLLKMIFLITIISISSVYGWKTPEKNNAIFTTYRYIHTKNGISYQAFDAPKKYRECREKNRITRGEYETKEEFKKRKKLQSTNCNLYDNPHNAKIIVSSKLKYNVDKGYFTYSIFSGNTYYKVNGEFDNVLTAADFNFNKKIASHIDKRYINNIKFFWKDSSFNSGGQITIKMFSPVKKARLLKTIEKSLELRLYGDFDWYYDRAGKAKWKVFYFVVKHIVLFNKEENKPIFIID